MLRMKISKRKKKEKKESALSMRRENAMQYFFEKSMGVFFYTHIVFSKNP